MKLWRAKDESGCVWRDGRLRRGCGPTRRLQWRLVVTRDFGALWWGQLISQVGDGLTKVALLWFVLQLTGSALDMAVVGVLQTVPPLVLSPLLGVYLDVLSKKHVMLAADLARATVLAAIPTLHALDALTLEGLYGLVFLNAIVSTAFGPALAAAVPELVSASHLMTANALIHSTTNVGVLVGPALGGVLIVMLAPPSVLYIDAVTFLVSAGCLLLIRAPLRDGSRACPTSLLTATQHLRAGLRFVLVHQRALRALLAATGLYTLGAGSFVYLLPLVVRDRLQAGSIELGWLWSALGAGMLAVSLALTVVERVDILTRLRLLTGALAAESFLVALLPQVSTLPSALVIVTLIGANTGVFTPVGWSIMQEVTPQGLRGRVFAVTSTVSMASASAGMVTFGWISDRFGATAGLAGVTLALLGAASLLACHSIPGSGRDPEGAGSVAMSDMPPAVPRPAFRPSETRSDQCDLVSRRAARQGLAHADLGEIGLDGGRACPRAPPEGGEKGLPPSPPWNPLHIMTTARHPRLSGLFTTVPISIMTGTGIAPSQVTPKPGINSTRITGFLTSQEPAMVGWHHFCYYLSLSCGSPHVRRRGFERVGDLRLHAVRGATCTRSWS